MLLNFETNTQHQDYFGWANLLLIFRHLDPPRMFALDHTQLAGLNPHTASFIRSDFWSYSHAATDVSCIS